MIDHVYESTGHGPKGLDSGCSCGMLMVEDRHGFHKFMREWLAENPSHGRAGTYHYHFQHWLDNDWIAE